MDLTGVGLGSLDGCPIDVLVASGESEGDSSSVVECSVKISVDG